MICPKCGYEPKGKTGIERLYNLVKHMEAEGQKNVWVMLKYQAYVG